MKKFSDFVQILENDSIFEADQLITVCKRENNSKRDFVFVNRYQGKHIPARVDYMNLLFSNLKHSITESPLFRRKEKICVIGFAETATAIGHFIADNLPNCFYYLQTTREDSTEPLLVEFQEEHSHATEQRLYGDLQKLKKCDRILFVDDEVSTGKTIKNFITELNKIGTFKYAIASFLNLMSVTTYQSFLDNEILMYHLIRGQIKDINAKIDIQSTENIPDITEFSKTKTHSNKELFVGTEEDMYYAFLQALEYSKHTGNKEVYFQASSRSPICPSQEEGYGLQTRINFPSVRDKNRKVYLYNLDSYDNVYIYANMQGKDKDSISDFVVKVKNIFKDLSNKCVVKSYEKIENYCSSDMSLVQSSYSSNDVTILLKDITGLVTPLPTEEREKLIQSGTHYSEMLPLEYKPSQDYMDIYERVLRENAYKTALAVCALGSSLYKKKGKNIVLVSLARAGTPIGILLKRYLHKAYHINPSHYSISIIRGKGIDFNALDYIMAQGHLPRDIQFVDGWIGKGAIQNELKKSLKEYDFKLDDNLAVLSDPAYVVPTEYCGSREDFIIPSSCLNATVSGLFSRTFRRPDIIGDTDFDGAIYYEELMSEDRSMEFIDTIDKELDKILQDIEDMKVTHPKGIEVVKRIAKKYGITDINKIKPGIGETTRVLLRRIPDKVLITNTYDRDEFDYDLEGILQLCMEKDIEWEYCDTGCYKAIGIIKDISDI